MKDRKYGFNKISVMWRPSPGSRRIHIGTITVPNSNKPISFKYRKPGVQKAIEIDKTFAGLPGLPIDEEGFSPEIIKAIIRSRLIDFERPDAKDFMDFWLIEPEKVNDPIYVVAQTQGITFNDMFEFVPQYLDGHNFPVISDVAGLSHYKIDLSKISVKDNLKVMPEPNNKYDSQAVALYWGNELVGYIKKGHSGMVFRHPEKYQVTVWDKNDFPGLKKLYIKIDSK